MKKLLLILIIGTILSSCSSNSIEVHKKFNKDSLSCTCDERTMKVLPLLSEKDTNTYKVIELDNKLYIISKDNTILEKSINIYTDGIAKTFLLTTLVLIFMVIVLISL